MENMTMPAILIDINLVWQIINFCVIMFIFKKKLFGPVSRIISERKALITKDMDDARIDKENAEKERLTAEAELKKAKAEALKILVEAEKKSEERKDAILKDAHAQREKMIKSGEAEVEKQKEIAMKDLQVYARNLISDFTEKLVSNKTASTLIDEAIDKVGEE
ncbi:MAG: F0F1 ATP synthase subunit B [Fusobacteriaceae bacterium]|nr:F0F1 ATP synthase subunit B [Fusobacteriaceae bacterium]MBP6467728.1 F0F1 ATP synthase subunit B [Fusobacteriaceae bacterium]MBP9595998.1 F0F1 ATP synthase subunit B [Fusobacteriaceae bacterium]MBU9917608.1 F0F1 ATP synthase subunit B [Fusobacteriaceae bacterium]